MKIGDISQPGQRRKLGKQTDAEKTVPLEYERHEVRAIRSTDEEISQNAVVAFDDNIIGQLSQD
jgi:hypothetical protein